MILDKFINRKNNIMGSYMSAKRDDEWGLKKKILFTFFLLVLYRVGVAIPLPFVNAESFRQGLETLKLDNVLMAMSMVGGSFSQLGLMSMGVIPYITASIIMQLMKVVVPKLEEMQRSDSDQKKVTQWTRYLAVVLATIQAVGFVIAAPNLLGFNVFTSRSPWAMVIAIFCMVMGSMIAMRIGEVITQRGIGNGTSLLIFTSILVGLPGLISNSSVSVGWIAGIGFVLILLALLALIVYIEKSEYRAKVIYTKSSRSSTPRSSDLPIKVSIAGVLPVIFASSMLSLPQLMASVSQADWVVKLNNWMQYGTPLYTGLFLFLTVFFTFFSLMLVFDTKKLTANMTSSGGFIAGKRPGEETQDYLDRKAKQLSVFGAIYLVVISLVSIYAFPIVGVQAGGFTATSVIILCSVVVTLLAAIDAERRKTATANTGFLR